MKLLHVRYNPSGNIDGPEALIILHVYPVTAEALA